MTKSDRNAFLLLNSADRLEEIMVMLSLMTILFAAAFLLPPNLMAQVPAPHAKAPPIKKGDKITPVTPDDIKVELQRLGSEWSWCKYVHPLDGIDSRGYTRLQAAVATRYEEWHPGSTMGSLGPFNPNIAGFLRSWVPDTAQSSADGLRLELFQERRGTPTLTHELAAEFVRKFNENQTPRRHEILVGGVRYYDLNGDGVIDAWWNSDGVYRIIEGRLEKVPADLGFTGTEPPESPENPGPRRPFRDEPPPRKDGDPPAEKPKPRVLGPEWVKTRPLPNPGSSERYPLEGGPVKYIRPGANLSYRKEADTKTRHTLLLDGGGGVDVYEWDDNSAIVVELIGAKPGDVQFSLRREFDQQRKPSRHEFRLGPVTYYDIDGDGMIDGWVDHRGGKPNSFILVADRVVKIENDKVPFRTEPGKTPAVWDEKHQSGFQFDKGKWSPTKT
jgi:hypothetical protein